MGVEQTSQAVLIQSCDLSLQPPKSSRGPWNRYYVAPLAAPASDCYIATMKQVGLQYLRSLYALKAAQVLWG